MKRVEWLGIIGYIGKSRMVMMMMLGKLLMLLIRTMVNIRLRVRGVVELMQ
jgi:hypothetical protein